MKQEEKAKAYDKALERAKKVFNCEANDREPGTSICEYIFPELAESEDERIRKGIKSILEHYKESGEVVCPYPFVSIDEALAWLERQGEQKPIIEMKSPEESLNINSKTYNKIVNDCIFGENKPNFKVGDWIISKYMHLVMQILNNDNGSYKTVETDGTERNDSYNFIERNFKLWTIQDAKDGDVLAFDNETIVIFKDLYNTTTFHSYCHVEEGVFSVSKDDMPDWWEGKGFHPATKKQHDTLFAKMKEAGYEWNAEKKKLKNIENEIEIPFGAKDSELQEVTYYIPKSFNAEIYDDKVIIKKGEKTTACSEEDKCMLNNVIDTLKPLSQTTHSGYAINSMIDWLKSLKQRHTWTPSDVQIHAFEQVYDWYNDNFAPSETLTSLYNDLKKLKGE